MVFGAVLRTRHISESDSKIMILTGENDWIIDKAFCQKYRKKVRILGVPVTKITGIKVYVVE